jgi:leader peptidase (prepilin peptidase)/N-methyltransferase
MLISDLETFIIPNSMQIVLLILNLTFAINNQHVLLYFLLNGAVYFAVFYAVGYAVKRWRNKDAIGGGDLKFFAIAGAILGFINLPLFLLISGLLGTIFGMFWKIFKKEEYFPFGPAIITAFLLLV